MTEIPQHVRKAINNILDYSNDEYKHFEVYYKEQTGKTFDYDEWDLDINSIPEEARNHIFYSAMVLEDWKTKNFQLE